MFLVCFPLSVQNSLNVRRLCKENLKWFEDYFPFILCQHKPNTATCKQYIPLCSILGEIFEPMAQKVIPDKERKEKEQIRKKEHSTLIQVDKQSAPISNFITNFKRQFREAKGLIDLNSLFGGKHVEQQKQTSEPESIIGATKTVIRSDFKNEEKNQAIRIQYHANSWFTCSSSK